MTFILEDEIRKANAAYFNALVGAGHITLPVSVQDVGESLAGWPFKKPKDDVDEDEPDGYEDTSDWPDDHKLDDPRRGQAKWINGR